MRFSKIPCAQHSVFLGLCEVCVLGVLCFDGPTWSTLSYFSGFLLCCVVADRHSTRTSWCCKFLCVLSHCWRELAHLAGYSSVLCRIPTFPRLVFDFSAKAWYTSMMLKRARAKPEPRTYFGGTLRQSDRALVDRALERTGTPIARVSARLLVDWAHWVLGLRGTLDGGACEREGCVTDGAIYYHKNHQRYYCEACAEGINAGANGTVDDICTLVNKPDRYVRLDVEMLKRQAAIKRLARVGAAGVECRRTKKDLIAEMSRIVEALSHAPDAADEGEE